MMKKIFYSGVLLFAAALFLAGCGGGKSDVAGDRGEALPPDPGEAGKATLEGIDSDNDGVRDDVQRWIELEHNEPELKTALRNSSASIEKVMNLSEQSIADTNELTFMGRNYSLATRCLFNTAGEQYNEHYGILLWQLLNTEDRARAYQEKMDLMGEFVIDPIWSFENGVTDPCEQI